MHVAVVQWLKGDTQGPQEGPKQQIYNTQNHPKSWKFAMMQFEK